MANIHVDNKLLDISCMYDDIEYEISKLVKDITARRMTIAGLVEDLRSLLTSPEVRRREHGTNVLSETLIQLPADFLTEAELKPITEFYNNRLKDHYQILSATFKGIVALAGMKNLPNGSARTLVFTLFGYVAVPKCSGPDRGNVYLFLSKFFETNLEELLKVDEVVYNVLLTIDGEKDLFILRFLFRWLPTFFRKVTLGHHVEDAFDVVSCYFPIDLRISHYVPSTGQDAIREEMVADLQECLCAVPEFSEYCVPLALKKLKSDLRNAKIDSLKLLKRGCDTFPVHVYEKHRTEIRTSIHREVVGCSDPEVVTTALLALDAVLRTLFRNSDEATFAEVSRSVVLSTRSVLIADPNTFDAANMILTCVSNVSETSCRFVVETCIPMLLEMYVSTSKDRHADEASSLLNGLAAQVAVYKKHCGTLDGNEHLARAIRYCVEAIDDERRDVRIAALDGLVLIADIVDDRNVVYERLLKIIVAETDTEACVAAVRLLKTFASSYPDEVISRFLHDNAHFSTCESDKYLDAMCAIASFDGFGDALLSSCSERCFDADARIRRAMMRCYRDVLVDYRRRMRRSPATRRLFDRIVDDFISFSARVKRCDVEDVFLEHLLEVMCELIEFDSEQTTTARTHVPKLLSLYDEDRATAVVLFEGLSTRLKRDVEIPSGDKIVDCLLATIVDGTQTRFVRNSATRLLSNLLNKADDPETILHKIESTLSKPESSTDDHTVSCVTASVTKALALRNHAETDRWIDKMFEYLSTYKSAAVGFRSVMTDDPLSLNAKSDCRMSVLYKQKFFTTCCVRLEKSSKDDLEPIDGACDSARATVYLIENASSPLLTMHFSKIARSIVRSLSIDDADIACITLHKLDGLLENQERFLIEYIQDFVPLLLTLAAHEKSMTVRIAALSCLGRYARYPDVETLLGYRQQVVSGIAGRLDDRKRLVRRAAAEARSRWCAINNSL